MQLTRAALAACALVGCTRATQTWDFCLKGDDPPIVHSDLGPDETAFDRAVAEGRTETFITQKGCRRFRHELRGDLKRTDQLVVVGTRDGQPVFKIHERTDLGPNLMRVSYDADEDGLDESVTEHTYDAGVWVKRVDTTYTLKTHAIRERVTQFPVAADRLRTIEEARAPDGGLEVTNDWVGPREHAPHRPLFE